MAITAYQTGPLAAYVGKFTQTVGGANQTLAISGTPVSVDVSENKTSGTVGYRTTWSFSVSGAITTITINCDAVITNGRIVVLYLPN